MKKLSFFKGERKELSGSEVESWKVLIVDDDEDVHRITKIVAGNLTFEGRPVEILSAYSKKEAMEIFKEHNEIALAIIDVVMEDKHAGLDLVKYIREELGNRKTRIVIRTGYPGYAPQKEVVLEYDINDYREKTELSSDKLVTVILSGLRSYRDLLFMEKEAQALRKVVSFASSISHIRDEKTIIEDFMRTVRSIGSTYDVSLDVSMVDEAEKGWVSADVEKTDESTVIWKDAKTVYVALSGGDYIQDVIRISSLKEIRGPLKNVLDVFLHTFVNARDKLVISIELNETLNEIILTLSEVLETRSEETGEHVYRVSNVVYSMAKALGLDEQTAFEWKLASMMHDIGKIGVPDSILNKPGKLTPEEFEIIKQHTLIGYSILSRSKRRVFRIAATIALSHHENWDGSGYPYGLRGDEIPLEARVTAIADVYDALSSDRVYRKAWPKDKVLNYIKENAGKKFDPALVKLFFEVI